MSNFNWQTEDDVLWDDETAAEETAVSRRRPWFTFIIIVAAVITAGVVIYRQVNERIETATGSVKSDILASQNLIQQAGRQVDVELFQTLLSGRDPAWADLQGELVAQGWLFERAALGLRWQPPQAPLTLADLTGDRAPVVIDLNPELSAAELHFNQVYEIEIGNGLTKTVTLRQTAVYRRGTQRWLYSPPKDAFWGAYTTNAGSVLTLAYPERDAAVAARLAVDLDAKLNEMCRTVIDIICPDDLRIHLRFDNNSESLMDAAAPLFVSSSGLQIKLPAPTLVGLPLDEAGYQALFRGYAAQVVTAVITNLAAYQCCDHVAFYQALLDYQLDRLGLRPFPHDKVDYARVIGEGITFEEMNTPWRSSRIDYLAGENGWLVYTAVDFIRQQFPTLSPAHMQRNMNNRRSLTAWLLVVTSETAASIADVTAAADLYQKWQQFALAQTQAEQGPPPVPLPEQDIYLLCTPPQESPITGLYQYDLATAEWTEHEFDSLAVFMSALPQADTLLLQTIGSENGESQAILWRDDLSQPYLPTGYLTFGQFDPPNRRLLVYGFNQEETVVVHVAEKDGCEEADCPLLLAAGIPVWSPDGDRFILISAEAIGQNPFVVNGRVVLFDLTSQPFEWPLYRGDVTQVTTSINELTRIGIGYSPFWLDETTFGYIWQIPTSSDTNRHQLVLMSTGDETQQPGLTETELLLALPDNNAIPAPTMRYVVAPPRQPNLLFIVALGEAQQFYIFSYDVRTKEVRYHLQVGPGENHSLSFSPDGRFLVLTGTAPESSERPFSDQSYTLFLYDITGGQVETFASTSLAFAPSSTYAWSADGEWLVIVQDNQMLTLVAPSYGYRQFIPHGLSGCSSVAWLNRGS